LTQSELDTITAPTATDLSTVIHWLKENNLTFTQRGVSNLDVIAPVAVASTMFSTTFHAVVHAETHATIMRAGSYSLPQQVYAAIATVFGLHGLPSPKPTTAASVTAASTDGPVDVTPDVIYSTYKVTPQKVRRAASNRQAVAEFQGMHHPHVCGGEMGDGNQLPLYPLHRCFLKDQFASRKGDPSELPLECFAHIILMKFPFPRPHPALLLALHRPVHEPHRLGRHV
jgi:hypothetical protein